MAKMIDISIQSAEKYLTSDKKLKEFLESPVKIYEKLDGIKIDLYHIDNTGIPEKDWVVGYKGNIIYSSEFEYLSDIQIKNSSISGSQFKFIFDYLKKVDSKSIPVNYEFFTEYLMRKPSLLSNYKYNHRLVLLACSPSKIDIAMGKVRSKGNFDISRRDEFAKLLKVDTPPIVFDGILRLFESGCKSKELLSIYNANKHLLTGELSDVSVFTDILLKLDSKYGNTPEGFVLDFGDKILKVQQSYQLDKDIRADKRSDYKMSYEEEKRYQDYVRLSALNIINKLKRPFREVDLPNILKEVANELKILKDIPEHKKKNKTQILDDIQSNCKRIIIKQLTGNKFFLFLGKFRILTKAHYNTIKEGLKTHNGGVVCLITGSKTKFSRDLRYKMLQTCFPDIRIVEHSSANIFRILQDIPVNISSVLCGTDRVNAYASMLSKAPDIKIQEFKRTDRDISATAVLENLENELYFKANTPKEIHNMYKEILKVYETPESRLHESFNIEYNEYDYVTRLVEDSKDTDLSLRDKIKLGIKERLDEATMKTEFFRKDKPDNPYVYSDLLLKKIENNEQLFVNGEINNFIVIKQDSECKKIIKLIKDRKIDNTNAKEITLTSTNGVSFNPSEIDKTINFTQSSKTGKIKNDVKLEEIGTGIVASFILNGNNVKTADDLKRIEGFSPKNIITKNSVDYYVSRLNLLDDEWKQSIIKQGNVLAKFMKDNKITNFNIHHDSEMFNLIKSVGKKVSRINNDKWNPADLFLIDPNIGTNDIKVFGANNDLVGFNNFCGIFDKKITGSVVSVSLKKGSSEALHGSIAINSLIDYVGNVKQDYSNLSKLTVDEKTITQKSSTIYELFNKTITALNTLQINVSVFNKFENIEVNSAETFKDCLLHRLTKNEKGGKISKDYFKSVIPTLDFLSSFNNREKLNNDISNAFLLASSAAKESCPHIKIEGDTLSYVYFKEDINYEIEKVCIYMNGDSDSLIFLKKVTPHLQVRSKGSLPQFMIRQQAPKGTR